MLRVVKFAELSLIKQERELTHTEWLALFAEVTNVFPDNLHQTRLFMFYEKSVITENGTKRVVLIEIVYAYRHLNN